MKFSKFCSALLQTASFVALADIANAQAQQIAQTQTQAQPAEQVLVTGSLIHGAQAVGVPITDLSSQDFQETGALTASQVLAEVPELFVQNSNVGTPGQTGTVTRPQYVLIRNVPKETLMMIDGVRYPFQNYSTCYVDPSIVPQLAIDRIDVLADGASATYGSDAVAGVINVILKRGFDGAITQLRYGQSTDIGNPGFGASQLYGRTWDGGDITATYEWYHENPVHGDARSYLTFNYEPFGFDDTTPIGAAAPGVVSTGSLTANPALAAVGFSAAVGSRTCSNCYSIPNGTGWNYGSQTPGPTTSWTTLLANPGVNNLRNPYDLADIDPSQDRNALTATFDQRLIPGVSLFFDGVYSNRRATQYTTPSQSPSAQQTLTAMAVPTANPYYPTGAPSALRVSYDLAYESNTKVSSGETALHYSAGFNIDLPYGWKGRVYDALSEDRIFNLNTGMVNVNMVSAALGNTVPALTSIGVAPQASFTKPSNVPYLNLFCDATKFTCNSPLTLAYINASDSQAQHYEIVENGINLDGPIFDLPGGTVRGALGGVMYSHHYDRTDTSNFSTLNTSVPSVTADPESRNVWAAFGQLNIPLVGENNRLPLVEAFNIEAALRYDHYDIFGGVTNPKVAATWTVGYGLSLRGTWGQSFRAPVFSESSLTGGLMVQPTNIVDGAASNTVTLNCPTSTGAASSTANSGSLNNYLNPTCSSSPSLLNPAGIRLAGGSGAALAAGVRVGQVLSPETATNWAVGFNFAPTEFLHGLNVDVTWYHLMINNVIGANTAGLNVNDPAATICTTPTPGCIYLVKPNLNAPITDPSNAQFRAIVDNLLSNPKSVVTTGETSILFVNDNAITNLGWRQLSGLDFNSRYDFDLGAWGTFNVGVNGNYKVEDKIQPVLGGPTSNAFMVLGSTVAIGNDTGGQLKYRGRLGWAAASGDALDGFSITGFMNFIPHSATWSEVNTTYVPPKCFWAAGFGPGSCYPGSPYFGPYSVFPSSVPGQYTFDLSVGYETGDKPANPYLQNINFQITVQNLLDRQAPFIYAVPGSREFPGVQTIPPNQRYITFVLTKQW